jgi:hypothetical protein
VRDGCLPRHDPSGALELLIAAVRATQRRVDVTPSGPRARSVMTSCRLTSRIKQLCGFVVATSADEAWNRRCVRLPPVTELPGETTLLEPNTHLQSDGEDGEAERNCERAKE